MITPQPLTRMVSMSPYVLFGKVALLVLVAVWAADAMTASARAEYARGEALTLEAYMAGYEEHRAGLMDDTAGFGLNATVMVILLAGAASLYEVVGYGIGRAVERVIERNREAGPDSPSGAESAGRVTSAV